MSEDVDAIRESVRALCRDFPNAYWRELDETKGYPSAFVAALTENDFLAARIPSYLAGHVLGLPRSF